VGRGEELKSSLSLDSLEKQVAADIESYIGRFSNESFAVRLLAKKANLSSKTIKRQRSGHNTPTYPTLFRIYAELTRAESEEELLALCPPVVRDLLGSKKVLWSESSVSTKSDFNLAESIKEQPVVGELYVRAAMSELEKNQVLMEYGKFGLDILEMLVAKGLLKKVTSTVYAISAQSPQFDAVTLQLLASHFLKAHYKPSQSTVKGKNTIGFYADHLSEDGYKAWLAIDERAFYEKTQLAKQARYRGEIPAFTMSATDTLLNEGEDQ